MQHHWGYQKLDGLPLRNIEGKGNSGKYNPVEDVLYKNKIKLTTQAEIKHLPIGVKLDLVTAWMRHENVKGCGVIHTGGRQEGLFMSGVIIPPFADLIDRFNDWVDIQPLTQLKNEKAYADQKGAIFIKTLIEFGERLATIYFKCKKNQAMQKDKKSGI